MKRIAALMAVWLLGAGASPASAREEFPLPPDVAELGPPAEMVLGAQPTRAQGYVTKLSPEGVRGFYRGALPKAGWTFAQLPWMEQIAKGQEAMTTFSKEHPEQARDPAAQRQMQMAQDGYRALSRQMDRVVYAVRGAERVLVMVEPGEQGTDVVIQRWEDADGHDGALGGAPDGASLPGSQATWPEANPCCGGGAVPPQLRKVPQSVPPYPNGRMITASEIGGGMSEISLTEDSLAEVMDFYREHMAYNGWTPVQTASPQELERALREGMGAQAAGIASSMLSFRNERALCSVIVMQHAAGVSPFDLSSLPPEARQQLPPEVTQMAGPERTTIAVQYMEMDPSLLPGGAR